MTSPDKVTNNKSINAVRLRMKELRERKRSMVESGTG